MLETLKDIAGLVRELDLGVGGFFALCFMGVFVWAAKRWSISAGNISGGWKELVEEGLRARATLREEVHELRTIVERKDKLIEELQQDYADLNLKYFRLEAKLRALDERTP